MKFVLFGTLGLLVIGTAASRKVHQGIQGDTISVLSEEQQTIQITRDQSRSLKSDNASIKNVHDAFGSYIKRVNRDPKELQKKLEELEILITKQKQWRQNNSPVSPNSILPYQGSQPGWRAEPPKLKAPPIVEEPYWIRPDPDREEPLWGRKIEPYQEEPLWGKKYGSLNSVILVNSR